MAIESSVPASPLPPESNNSAEAWLAGRQFEGLGFDELEQKLAFRLSAISTPLQEGRPIYFVSKTLDITASLNRSLSSLVSETAESLSIPLEPDLTTYLDSGEFNNRIVQQIVEDDRRPLIQPLAIGLGEHPRWWIGPLWIFPTSGPEAAFRRQLAGVLL